MSEKTEFLNQEYNPLRFVEVENDKILVITPSEYMFHLRSNDHVRAKLAIHQTRLSTQATKTQSAINKLKTQLAYHVQCMEEIKDALKIETGDKIVQPGDSRQDRGVSRHDSDPPR